ATISSVVREETPVRRVGALGGPVLTDELSAGAPCVMVVASRYPEVIKVVRHALGAPSLRIYASDDLVGLEWASALTSILAAAFAAKHKVNAPIFTSIAHGILAQRPPEELVRDLMMGPIVGPA